MYKLEISEPDVSQPLGSFWSKKGRNYSKGFKVFLVTDIKSLSFHSLKVLPHHLQVVDIGLFCNLRLALHPLKEPLDVDSLRIVEEVEHVEA